jgi:chemotaxis protein MotD
MAVAADVVVQFTAALELLRHGASEEEQNEEPQTASTTWASREPAAETATKQDDNAAKTAGAEADASAETAEPAAAKTPVASPAADAALEIDGVKKIAVQTQTTTPSATAAQLLVSTQPTAKDIVKAEGATKPADAAKSGDSRLATIDTTAAAKVPAASGPSTDGQTDQNPDDGQNAAPEARRVEPATTQTRGGVFVDPATAIAAPPAPSINANAIANTIAGVEGLRPGTETVAQMLLRLSSSQGGQVQSLKIQLHPAELGVVTAQLNFAGDQLSVELKVENAEAYHRLSLDTETIAKSLRTLGFDVDQVSVQQPQTVTSASARADIGGNSAGNFGRDGSSFQSWGSSNGESGTGGQAAGRGRENGGGRHETNAQVRQNSAGSDIYI